MVSSKELRARILLEKLQELRTEADGRVQLWIRAARVSAQVDQILRALMGGHGFADFQRRFLLLGRVEPRCSRLTECRTSMAG